MTDYMRKVNPQLAAALTDERDEVISHAPYSHALYVLHGVSLGPFCILILHYTAKALLS